MRTVARISLTILLISHVCIPAAMAETPEPTPPADESTDRAETPAVFSGELEVSSSRATEGETPVTMTEISREEIERRDWGQDVPLLLQGVPGFYAYNDNGNGMGYSYFFLRGFDMRRTAISLNGVPLNDAHSHGVYFVDLADFASTTEDIQIQRGVGTNLYGGSAIGGAVDLQTRAPLAEPRVRLSGLGGSWGTRTSQVEYDTGLFDDRWAATIRYSRSTSDGYRELSWLEAWNYFATLQYYGRRSTTRLVLFGGSERTHLAYEGITQAELNGEITGNRREDRRRNPLDYPGEIDRFSQPHYQLINTVRLNDTMTLNTTLYAFEGNGYYKQYKAGAWLPEYNLDPIQDADGNEIDTADLVRKRNVDEWDAGWIGTLNWRHGEGRGRLRAGAAVRFHDGRHRGTTVWAGPPPPSTPQNHPYYDYDLSKTTVQPFVEETWRLTDRWSVFGGLTWTSHRYHMDRDRIRDLEVTETFDYLLPRIGVTFKPNERWSVYGNVSRGAREPAFRDIFDPQDYWFGERPHALDIEDLIDTELGIQYRSPSLFGRFNLYHLNFDNAIVWAGGLDSDGLPTTANGAKTTHRGAELEVGVTIAPRSAVQLAASFTEATFDRFEEFGWDGTSMDHRGNQEAGVPEWLASLEWTAGWGPVDVVTSVRHAGRFYLDNTENLRKYPELKDNPGFIPRVNDAFTTADVHVKVDLSSNLGRILRARSTVIDVRVNNVFDSLYTTFGYVWGPEPTWIPAATRSVYGGLTIDW